MLLTILCMAAVCFNFPPQMQLVFGYYCLSFSNSFFSPHFSSISPFKYCYIKKKDNRVANYDENSGTVGFGFADTRASEYSEKKKKKRLHLSPSN